MDPTHYAKVVVRNRYLARKYDPSSTIDQAENLVTGAMSDPARVLTPSEQAEHQGLNAAIVQTLYPTPTPDEARLEAISASPLGTIASLGVRASGGSQASQDVALNLGAAAEGVGLSLAGARAGPATVFLGAQTGGSISDGVVEDGVVGEAVNAATFGLAASNDYRSTFFAVNPELEGKVVVHHAVERQVLTRYPDLVSDAEMHSLENLAVCRKTSMQSSFRPNQA